MPEEVETVDLEKETTKADLATEADQQQEKPKTEQPPDDKAKDQPGTPDKAMQKMQQELGNVTRQLAALTEKQQQTGELSDADKAKLQKAQERVDKIRKFASRGDVGDGLDEVNPIAAQVVDLTEKLGELEQTKTALQQANERLASLENDRNWQVARAKYSGLDVDAIWEKANADALETLGDEGTVRAVNRLASKMFEERCDAAKKRQGGDEPAANKKTAAASSPSQYRVGSGAGAAPVLSEEQELLALARQLVTEE